MATKAQAAEAGTRGVPAQKVTAAKRRGGTEIVVPPVEEDPSVRRVDGVPVVKDEPVFSPLPTSPIFKGLRRLELEDGRVFFGCADCTEFVGTRGQVRVHRADRHGAGIGGVRRKVDLSDVALNMTVRELHELAGHVDDWDELFDRLTAEKDGWRDRATRAEADLKQFKADAKKFRALLDRAGV